METCGRCQGSGEVTYAYRRKGEEHWTQGKSRHCPVCLGLGTFTPPVQRRSPNQHHLVAIHDSLLEWDEIVALLPLREPKENWNE